MKKISKLEPQFVSAIPQTLESGILYASMDYATVAHLCCCGCGREVITPLTPTDWKLTYDGQNISMYPSIGNWSFPCRSHYWISNGEVQWAEGWSQERIQAGRDRDRRKKAHQFGDAPGTARHAQDHGEGISIWTRIKRLWRG
jgi:hypothetical protein